MKFIKLLNIKPYDHEALYSAVGKIIENAQHWEKEYRECLLANGISMKALERKTLIKISQKLLKNKKLTKAQYDIIAQIIELRNRINHSFFIEIAANRKTEQDWFDMEDYLNTIMALIHEARDFTNNLANANDKNHTHVPNVIEDKNI